MCFLNPPLALLNDLPQQGIPQVPGSSAGIGSQWIRWVQVAWDFPTTLNTNDIHVFITNKTIFTNISVIDSTHHQTLSGWPMAALQKWPSLWHTRKTAGPGPGPYGCCPALQGSSQCQLITMPKKICNISKDTKWLSQWQTCQSLQTHHHSFLSTSQSAGCITT